MSQVPPEIPGVGRADAPVRVKAGFDPMRAGLGPEEYFVWSRIVGTVPLREVVLATGLPVPRAIEIVTRLHQIGAIEVVSGPATVASSAMSPGRGTGSVPAGGGALGSGPVRSLRGAGTEPPMTRPAPSGGGPDRRSGSFAIPTFTQDQPSGPVSGRTPTPPQSGPTPSRTSTPPRVPMAPRMPGPGTTGALPILLGPPLDLTLPGLTADEQTALDEPGDLKPEDRRRVLAMVRHLRTAARPGDVLGLAAHEVADARAAKRAYFGLSKQFHPDRFYGKKLGTFAPRLATIFEALSAAHASLSHPAAATPAHPTQAAPQSPTAYALDLFGRACDVEIRGEPLEAMKLFAAAIRLDPQQRYLRRAASCALAAEQPRTAEEYARKAAAADPGDASVQRLLAQAFRAQNKLETAEEILVMALAVPIENDTLMVELRRDLADLRKQLGRP